MHPECTPVVVVTPAPLPAGDRYVIKSEPAPMPKPSWWRSLWLVVDTATDSIVSRHKTWGSALMDSQCRNLPDNAFCRSTRETAAEIWGWAS
ncbi:MAG: hypothetical protein QM692_16065 [Thermomicrobiales bacterium]